MLLMGGGRPKVNYLIRDYFTDADTTAIASHTIAPVNIPAASWTAVNGAGTTTAIINSNTCVKTATNNDHGVVVLDHGITTYRLQVDIVPDSLAVNPGGLAARYVDGNNFVGLRIRPDTSKIELYKRVSGTFTLLDDDPASFSVGVAYTLTLDVSPTVLTGYLNGVALVTANDTTNASSTKSGLWMYRTVSTWDNFAVIAPPF
jgi:hypothetical protein